jgi:hypothetical protein
MVLTLFAAKVIPRSKFLKNDKIHHHFQLLESSSDSPQQ